MSTLTVAFVVDVVCSGGKIPVFSDVINGRLVVPDPPPCTDIDDTVTVVVVVVMNVVRITCDELLACRDDSESVPLAFVLPLVPASSQRPTPSDTEHDIPNSRSEDASV